MNQPSSMPCDAVAPERRQPPPCEVAPGLHPRFVVRVGITGHRPGRLAAAGEKREPRRSLRDICQELSGALEGVLREIGEQAAELHREDEGRLYSTEKPLVRLVVGSAMGVDHIASKVVATKLRDKDAQIEWQIDMILPCLEKDFKWDAWEDFDRGRPGFDLDDQGKTREGYWNCAFERADTQVILPQSWRHPEAVPNGKPGGAPPRSVGSEAGEVRADAGRETEIKGERPTPVPNPEVEVTPAYIFETDYTPAAGFLLRHSDLLIAVWDGETAVGPGGTADIASAAFDEGTPVIYLNPAVGPDPHMLKDVERDVPRAAIRTWFRRPMTAVSSDFLADGRVIRESMEKVLRPPTEAAERKKLESFLAEARPERQERQVYEGFCAMIRWDLVAMKDAYCSLFRKEAFDAPAKIQDEWNSFVDECPDEGHQGQRLKLRLGPRFCTTELLALRYEDRYRGLHIGMYALACLAVFLALVSLLKLKPDEVLPPGFALLMVILLLVPFARWAFQSYQIQKASRIRLIFDSEIGRRLVIIQNKIAPFSIIILSIAILAFLCYFYVNISEYLSEKALFSHQQMLAFSAMPVLFIISAVVF